MASEKFENLLNLALDATEREREKSLNLGVGYEPEEERWELIVKYSLICRSSNSLPLVTCTAAVTAPQKHPKKYNT